MTRKHEKEIKRIKYTYMGPLLLSLVILLHFKAARENLERVREAFMGEKLSEKWKRGLLHMFNDKMVTLKNLAIR